MFFWESAESAPGVQVLASSAVHSGPELFPSALAASVANLEQFHCRSAITQDFHQRQLAASRPLSGGEETITPLRIATVISACELN